MTAQTLSCNKSDAVDDVLRLMGSAQVRRRPVLNGEDEISAPGEVDHSIL